MSICLKKHLFSFLQAVLCIMYNNAQQGVIFKGYNKQLNLHLFSDNTIKDFMLFYRKSFPHDTVTPKLHMLEHHAVVFIKRWQNGFGLYGEQGAESIHSTFNKLFQTYCMVKPNRRRLECVLKEHLTRVYPEAQHYKPTIVKRKLKRKRD